MTSLFITAFHGIHGLGTVRIFHWLFRENPMIGFGFLLAIVLYALYRYNQRR
ncbi:hypothetical protein FD04_GL002454 [Secundilactobacillus odoratitofui DSM 19909 = JCM 15043]|uniref:Uncharacterized protein n=1 Tax=Secundilactobacillus odoratitofui DSM 19909 = JCM 15043 TaxID=1423776 RepID=A0A0R1LVK0_9LACO|nr:hypothetical protein [Secundilactobacillus odoratitofui]KRK99678.1 hypothetical protein FD04_GL002454 [Secundilactobacillus odoratitofui DSM 19909 = JCM 15043]